MLIAKKPACPVLQIAVEFLSIKHVFVLKATMTMARAKNVILRVWNVPSKKSVLAAI